MRQTKFSRLHAASASFVMLLSSLLSGCSPSAGTALPPEYDGSMMPYDFANVKEPELPDSLTPVYIDYVARHGARFLSSEKKVKSLLDAFDKARKERSLTSLGKEFEKIVNTVISHTNGRWGALDSVGRAEQVDLAIEMSKAYPELLKEGRVISISTYVPRVVMSMYEFAHTLGAQNKDLQIYTAEGKQFNPLLRFFTTDSAYVKYLEEKPWKADYDAYVEKHISPEPALQLFGSIGSEKELRKLTLDIYGVLQSLRAAGLPAPDTRWLTTDEYKSCWEAANLEHYYARTANRFSTVPVKAAVPLLNNIIADADVFLKLNQESQIAQKAYLCFGHAETLMPLLSLCEVEGCNFPDLKAEEVANNWKDYDIVPLGANFEIVFLKAPSGNVYALTRLNGQNVKIGSFSSPIVPWKDLRTFWQNKMATLS